MLALLAGCSSGMAVPSSTTAKSQSASASPSSAKSTTASKSPSTSASKATSTAPKPTVSSAAPSLAGKAYLKDGVVYGTGYSYKLPANYTFEVAEQGDDTAIKHKDKSIAMYTIVKPASALDTSCGVRDRYMEDAKTKSTIPDVKIYPDVVIDGVKACSLSLRSTSNDNSFRGHFVVKDGVLYILTGASAPESITERGMDLVGVTNSWKWK